MGVYNPSLALSELAHQLNQIAENVRRQDQPKNVFEAAPRLPKRVFVERSEDSEQLLMIAIAWLRARDVREAEFGTDLFGDPAWNILLDLYIQRCKNTNISVSSVCIAAGTPMTTSLRWIGLLCNRGLLVRAGDPFDKRRSLVSLTALAVDKIEQTLRRAADSDRKLGLGRLQALN